MTPPPWPDIPALLRDWVDDVVQLGQDIAAERPLPEVLPEMLARVHNRFEQIHRFLDGNGRTGQLGLNLILVRLGYPPVVIFERQRDGYLRAMNSVRTRAGRRED